VEAIQLVGSLGCPCHPFLQAAPHHLAQYRLGGGGGVVGGSVADPDPHVFGPPGSGSGSISQRYGSGPDPDLDPSITKQKK
jgi:hypothetical protein